MKLKHIKIESFAEKVKEKKIYCFGAGKALTEFLAEPETEYLKDNIKYIVDNAKEKQGDIIKYSNKCISVISFEKMLQSISLDDVIVITTKRFVEILEQLSNCDQLSTVDCYIYYYLRMEQNDYERDQVIIPKAFSAEAEICIPKKIHYCWFGRGEIPKQNRIWMESWKKYCPDYQIIEWNEENYDVSKNLYMKQAYERGKWAFVSDYARVDIISEYGGVYLDTDVELIRNIDDLLKNKAFCGFESRNFVSFGLGFGAVKKNSIIEALKNDYENRKFVMENGQLNEITCPVYQTDLLVKCGLIRNGQMQILEDITVYPERVLCGISPFSYKMTQKPDDTYSVHHFSGSWLSKEEQVIKKQIIQNIHELENI